MKNKFAVAVRIRPQNARELAAKEKICVFISQDEPQITIGRDKSFTYDFVFSDQSTQEGVYNKCIHNLLAGAFDGYNATVLAYGQTGSGKTYTMGTCFDVNQFNLDTNITDGIIPRAASHLFEGMEERKLAAKTNGAVEPKTALKAGSLNRTTAATNMNQQSSRSHAIFTIRIKQSRVVPIEGNEAMIF
uniref:Kinesin motor domain-containing protein n=1 Tax=Meloidogyne javanica TaxID=6303 RepID=A0A915M562_MELJA